MARYYEETTLIEFVKKYTPTINGETTMKCVEQAIRNAPTADVVPKSEVEKLKQDLEIAQIAIDNRNIELEGMRTAANSYKMHYENLAREIFEEIEKCMKHDYISSIGVYSGALGLRIAELKKKYTEQKNG